MTPTVSTGPAPDGPQFQKTCFGCGSDNPYGLQLKFQIDPAGSATASLIPGSQWEGLCGIIHGGIVATLLDEAVAKAVAAQGHRSVTAEMRVRFRHYAKTGEPLQVRGWVAKRKKRIIEAEASLTVADGSECAHAWAVFLRWEKGPRAQAPQKE